MKLRMRLVFLGLVSTLAVQCAHLKGKSEPKEDLSHWHGRMHSMAASLAELLPIASSQRAFNDPKNEPKIVSQVQQLAKDSRSINMTAAKPSNDPAIEYSAERFADNMNQALEQLNAGNRPYARKLIQQSANYCMSCHTRTDQGRSNLQFSSLADLTRLSKLEQMDFYIAVRDYDNALNAFDKLVNSEDAQIENPYAMEVAAEKALALVIRVKRDPELANELVSRIIDARWAPVYLRVDALNWKKAIVDWQNQSRKAQPPAQQMREAKALLNQAWRLNALSSHGRAGLVYFLRASTLLHELLDQNPKGPLSAEALYYAGMTAEGLRDINLWTLNNVYFESCIRQMPHSLQAKKCYLRLEASEFLAYAGSDAVYIPDNIRRRLSELKNLAETQNDQLNDWMFKGE